MPARAALLETVLRRALADRPTVRVREGRKVTGLLGDRGGRRVTGVRVAASGSRREMKLLADLVVDASGTGSRAAALAGSAAGRGEPRRPTRRCIESGRQFVSRWFHLKPADEPGWHSLAIAPSADAGFRSAMMLRAERNRWGVVLLTATGEPLPSDDADFLRFAGDLADGELGKVLGRARPASPIYRYGPTASRMMHYDRMATWPVGLVAIGDLVRMFDPYFGLGMTAAARVRCCWRTILIERAPGRCPACRFKSELAALNAEPWQLVTGHDIDGRLLPRDTAQLGRAHAMAPSKRASRPCAARGPAPASSGRNAEGARTMRIAVRRRRDGRLHRCRAHHAISRPTRNCCTSSTPAFRPSAWARHHAALCDLVRGGHRAGLWPTSPSAAVRP